MVIVIMNDLLLFSHLEVPVHAHVDQLVSNTCKSAIHHVQEIEYLISGESASCLGVPLFDLCFV